MTRSSVAVTFPDGEVRHALFNGTVDILWPALFETIEDAWGINGPQTYRDILKDPEAFKRRYYPAPVGEPEPVTICVDYDPPVEWQGQATRNCVIGPLEPYGDES